MMPKELMPQDLADTAEALTARQEPFAFATIVRTAGATAAKPGAKALLAADGTVLQGWLGGGCTTGAVRRAAQEALASGTPQLVSVAPQELLAERGVSAGEMVAGTRFVRNGCPSEGSVDIFIEPCLPSPELLVFGASPVAEALAALAPQFHWEMTQRAAEDALAPAAGPRRRVIVVATQGQGDLVALKTALGAGAEHVAFVGSRKKYAALAQKLIAQGHPEDAVRAVSAPAGLDIGAVTPEEIALSILAELTRIRRAPPCEAADA
ncbi:Carbon monoxide dehydrogenase F protein [Candidatus Rhodobacter oscarellae]|uniref:Carbon monoxide dehydrogenase F protein n=1 Tax=Candidatus Rhodobacter oscarellae TaxID=1675527 RepID=A0A0J9E599_9RHOB|nr:XdhC family protein [Candidatus Rhodobacter lobularis]KMW57932.1 Carbon monoxide dehydrogenase F protein [Candidatus Rhodobacter lobularis]